MRICLVRTIGLLAVIGGVCVPRTALAQSYVLGTFSKNTTAATGCSSGCPTNVVTHNLGVTPKALILWSDGKTDANFGAHFLWGFGMTDGTTSRSAGAGSQNAAPNARASRRNAAKVMMFYQGNGSGTLLAEADFTSWDSTDFTITWTTNDTQPYVIHYLLIGGTGVSAKVVVWQGASANGVKSITGVGFQPDLVINVHHGWSMGYSAIGGVPSPSIISSHAGFGIGVMDASGNQWANGFYSIDGAGTMDTQRGQRTNATFFAFNNALTGTKVGTCVVPCMTADGFDISFTLSTGDISGIVFSLALQGVNFKIGSFTKNTTAASGCTSGCPQNVIGSMGFQPSAVVLTSVQNTTQTNPQTHSRFGFGAFDGITVASSALTDLDAVGTSNVWAVDKVDKAFTKVNNNNGNNTLAPAIDASADMVFDADGFTLNWTTNDTVATQILYLALGPLTATAVTLESFTARRLSDGRVVLEWRTGYEADNVGFRLHREQNGARVRITPSLVPGAALIGSGRGASTGRSTYTWTDTPSVLGPVQYWLEDVDLKGKSTWHGPFVAAGAVPVSPR